MKKLLLAALLVATPVAAKDTVLIIGGQFQSTVVECGSLTDAFLLLDKVSESADAAKSFLEAADNTCAVGPSQFTPIEQVGKDTPDHDGHVWRLIHVETLQGTRYIMTTAELEKPGVDI